MAKRKAKAPSSKPAPESPAAPQQLPAIASEAAGPSPDRIAQVIDWLVGEQRTSAVELERRIVSSWPDADPKALATAVAEELTAIAEEPPAVLIGFVVEAAREVYGRALAAGEYGEALKALSLLARLTGG